jgi:hypothetical protein
MLTLFSFQELLFKKRELITNIQRLLKIEINLSKLNVKIPQV